MVRRPRARSATNRPVAGSADDAAPTDWARFAEGDPQAFASFYAEEAPGVHDFLARIVRDQSAAEDLTQTTFTKAWEQRGTIRDPKRVRGWVYSIARHLALTQVTRRTAIDSIDVRPDLVSAGKSPEGEAIDRETAALVWSAASSLAPRQYAVLDLSVRRQFSTPEIADALGVAPSHAAVLVNRARSALGNAVRALLVAQRRDHCDRLAELVPVGVRRLTAAQRESVDHHMRRCDICSSTAARLTSPVEILGGLIALPLPPSLTSVPTELLPPAAQTVMSRPLPSQKAESAPAQQSAAGSTAVDTTSSGTPATAKLKPNAAERSTRHVAGLPRPAALAVVGAAMLGVIALSVVHLRAGAPRSSSTTAGTPYDYVAAKASDLHNDPDAMVAFVRDSIAPDTYPGALRGPVGTLWAASGNDLDRALLLRAFLGHTNRTRRLVRGAGWGVTLDDGHGGTTYAGPTRPADATAVPATPSESDYQTVSLTVHTTDTNGHATDELAGTWHTADLGAQDIGVTYTPRGTTALLTVTSLGTDFISTTDAKAAQSQSLIFTLSAPGQEPVHISRELFSAASAGYVSLFDPSNRYTVVVTGGWVTSEVRGHEADQREDQLKDPTSIAGQDALNHMVAYTFLANSDQNTQALTAQQHLPAHFTSPRITVSGNELDRTSGGRAVSLDLRKNDIAIDSSAEDGVKFNTEHSLYDASLESQVVQQVTGQQTMSAADSLAGALKGGGNTVAQRVVLLGQSVNRLLTDPVGDLATFSVASQSTPSMAVTFTRRGDRVQATLSGPASAALTGSSDSEVRWLTGSPMLASGDDVQRAVAATEISLASAAHLPMDYTPIYTFTPTPQFYWHVTNFVAGNPVQQSSITLTPNVVVRVLPYYAGDTPPPTASQPTTNDLSTISIANDDLNNATVIKNTFGSSESTNKNILEMVSRSTYHDLKTQGWALVKFQLFDGTLSDPVRLYVVGTAQQPITVNGKTVQVRILNINGDFDKNHSSKPTDPSSGPDLVDPSNTAAGAYNKFPILDDANYPFSAFLFIGGNNQTDLPGSVVDATSGLPISGASVRVVEPDSTTTTWADGRFSLPAFNQPFGSFEVQVQAPGYTPIDTHVDFTNPASLPLAFHLQATTPPASTWVNATNVDAALGRLPLADRSQALIRQEVADPNVAVLVPGQPVATQFGPIDAWLFTNQKTGEMYPMFPDGLFGASTLRDLGTAAGNAVTDLTSKGTDWVRQKWDDWYKRNSSNPFDFNKAKGDVPIAFFAGHIAGWYYFAAGALTAVSANIANPALTICDLHRITVVTAVGLVNGSWQQTAAGFGLSAALQNAYGIPPAPTGNNQAISVSFKSGALSAIAALTIATKNEWGLAGQNC